MVNRFGARFTNEAANYNALGGAFHQFDAASFSYLNQPCWLIMDQGFVDRYGGFGTRGRRAVAGLGASAPTTCRRWPRGSASRRTRSRPRSPGSTSLAEKGHDDDFGRGDSAYDGWCGDRSAYPGTAATLGPVDTAPFYAVELISLDARHQGRPAHRRRRRRPPRRRRGRPRPVRGRQRDGRRRPGWSTAAPAARSARRWSSATGPGAQPHAAPPECLYRGNGTSGEVPFPRKWHLRRR